MMMKVCLKEEEESEFFLVKFNLAKLTEGNEEVKDISTCDNDIESILNKYYGNRLSVSRSHNHCVMGKYCKPCLKDECIYIGNAIANNE